MYAIFALRGLGTEQFLMESHFAVKNVEIKLRYNMYVFLYVSFVLISLSRVCIAKCFIGFNWILVWLVQIRFTF